MSEQRNHADSHEHGHRRGGQLATAWSQIKHAVTPHSHDSSDIIDPSLEASARGMRALWISFGGLVLTAISQLVVVV
jgi:hypothetical protein